MNVFDYLFDTSQHLDKDFVLGSQESISFKELHGNSLKIASFLKENVGEGNNIILISPNNVFFITAYLGILKSGNTCVPLNFAVEQETLDFISKTTACKTVFIAKSIRLKLNFAADIQCVDESNLSDMVQVQNILEFPMHFDDNTIAEIIFTSGSTGTPKGVMITHGNIISNTGSIVEYLELTQKDTMCVVLPFFYCYGLSLLHTHLRVGGSIVLNNTFIFLGSVINDLINYKCTGFAGVPSHFQILLKKSKTFKDTEFSDLRYVTQAGGKLHDVFINDFVASFPNVPFFVMYGQTEATSRLSYLPPPMLQKKIGSAGKAIPGVTFKVVDKEGRTVGVNQEGELLASGNNVMLGYYKDPESTKDALKEGWLYTGDIAKMDRDGYIYIMARKKEIIKVGGKRVSPKEIEEVVLSAPEVVDCTIVGVEDDILGEAIEATIVLNTKLDHEVMKDKILALCAKKLSAYKIPQKIVFTDRLVTNATGKKVKM